MEIIEILPEHWEEVSRIYQQGMDTGNATFQKTAPKWEEWNASHLEKCRLVGIEEGEVVGWAALSPVSSRCVYAGVTEVSIYIAAEYHGRGFGSQLMKALIQTSETVNIWTLQSGIFPENEGSIHLHLKHGFRKLGIRERVGKMEGRWRDVVLMERRSEVVGVE
ncbi:N-acetyltransferase family protein [Persicobacter diffluens]|uniref:Phosphinothricin N-acetyltransferase n=1 Tax=Persicobacter diffluens TaxID=981 RepID=A0AAN5ALY9_9BACT|nr:phosphinothricin N-acetyltransferase [Persicobacter diffluens]